MRDGLEFDSGFKELNDYLSAGNKVYFLIPRKYKKFFRDQTLRINKMEIMLNKRYGLLSRISTFLYMMYVAFAGFSIARRDKGLDRALTVYTTMWRQIGTIAGEDYEEDKVKVIFTGRNLRGQPEFR